MAATQLPPRRLHRSPATTQLKTRTAPLVPEAQVKDMLRDIAFVLRLSRRLGEEIRESLPLDSARPS